MKVLRASIAAALAMSATLASAQAASSTVEERLQRLEAEQIALKQQQAELQRQLAERDARIKQLEQQVQAGGAPAVTDKPRPEPGSTVVAGPAVAETAVSPGQTPAARGAPEKGQAPRIETWGEFDPGEGFLIGRSELGELDISAYAMVRWIDQNDGDAVFKDHFGNERPVDTRNDIFSHRIMVFFKGWLVDPKLVYNIFLWTVNATDQNAIFGNIGYQFDKKFSLYAGVAGNPGSRSLSGSHPYWLGHDRVMADEFFRPYFGSGIWAIGEVLPGLWYDAMLSNNNSALGVKASQLDRKMTSGLSLWWMPTTHEFGPRGGYGDYEYHERLATRFGFSTVYSPEQSFADFNKSPSNTTLRLADSVNLFETGALAPGVTIDTASYQVAAVDAGLKYKGMFLQAEYYWRRLDKFVADGALPVKSIDDTGFYVQAAFFPIREKLEVYGATSQIYGEEDAGFGDSSEYILGMNYYPFHSHNHRLNLQLMDVNKSPTSSTFGYYTAGQDGWTVASSFSIFF
jgi:DNA-binding protein H-NS